MKLQHYLGGLEGLPEPLTLEKRVFVEEWEKRIFGIHVAMMGLSNHLGAALPGYPIDEVPTAFKDEWTWADLRTGAEAMNPPFDYFKFRYYEKWLGGITQFFIDKGYVTEEELAQRITALAPDAEADVVPAIDDQVIAYLRLGDSPRRDVAHPKFAVGEDVRITNVPPTPTAVCRDTCAAGWAPWNAYSRVTTATSPTPATGSVIRCRSTSSNSTLLKSGAREPKAAH